LITDSVHQKSFSFLYHTNNCRQAGPTQTMHSQQPEKAPSSEAQEESTVIKSCTTSAQCSQYTNLYLDNVYLTLDVPLGFILLLERAASNKASA
uniref:Uncharacterized protein n=1 Tax=Astyanax mexicanus TaxID=7994 RepID=A0A3B1KL49_ASTMX